MSVCQQQLRWICFLLLLFAVGCGSNSNQSTNLPVCTPSTGDPNPYRSPDTSVTYLIYQTSQSQNQGTQSASTPTSQRDAFNLLEKQVRNWSAYEDVLVKDNLIIRITVTYISPELIEALVLNQILYSGLPPSPDFPSEVKNVKNSIADREELLFLVTVTASEYREKMLPDDGLMIDIPIKDMTLTNTSDLSVIPHHADKNLDDEITLRGGPEYGYLGYPLAVQKDGVCSVVMDPRWDTTLTLHVPNVLINNSQRDALTWSIGFRSLVDMNAPDIDPDELAKMVSNSPSSEIPNYTPAEVPPLPVNGASKTDTPYWDDYWDNMSRYVWYYLTNTTHH